MSHRSTEAKKIRKLKRALRRAGASNTSIDLIEWLKSHDYAQTTGAAVRLLIAGKVRVDSHVVGRTEIPIGPDRMGWGAAPLVPSHYRERIVVDD